MTDGEAAAYENWKQAIRDLHDAMNRQQVAQERANRANKALAAYALRETPPPPPVDMWEEAARREHEKITSIAGSVFPVDSGRALRQDSPPDVDSDAPRSP